MASPMALRCEGPGLIPWNRELNRRLSELRPTCGLTLPHVEIVLERLHFMIVATVVHGGRAAHQKRHCRALRRWDAHVRLRRARDPASGAEEKHNPAKLDNVDQLLEKFKGKESLLYKSSWVLEGWPKDRGICEKYGVEPDSRWLPEKDSEKDSGQVGPAALQTRGDESLLWSKITTPLPLVRSGRRASLARVGARTWVA